MTTALELTVHAHRVNAWLLYLLGRPAVVIDGREHRVRWRTPTRVPVSAGKHAVAVGFRYRGTPWLLGVRERGYMVAEDVTLHLSAKNGPLDSEPFHVEIGAVTPSAA